MENACSNSADRGSSRIRRALISIKFLALTISFFLIDRPCFSQIDSLQQAPAIDSAEMKYDSATNQLFHHIKEFGDSEQRKKLRAFTEDTISTRQDETIELTKKLLLEAQNYLENGLDTTGLSTELNKIKYWYDITSDGVFTNTGTMQTHGNLETSYKIMRELLTRMTERKSSLDDYRKTLVGLRNTIDSLYKEDILYKFSSDSAVLMRYAERLTVVLQEIQPIDSSLKKTLISVSDMQPTVNRMVNKLSASIEQIGAFQKEISFKQFHRETSNLGGPVKYVRRFGEIISFSMVKGWLAFIFFARNEIGKILLMLLLIIACTIFLLNLKHSLKRQNLLDKNSRQQCVLKYPILSAIVIVLNCFQFAFIDPPFVFTVQIWIISGLSLSIILKDVVAKYWMRAWLILFFLFLLACFDRMILQASRPERWMMLALSLAGIVSGSAIILRGRRNEIKETALIYFIGFVVIMQIASILNNSYGRYNLSKTCMTAGFFSVVLAMLFFWTLQLVDQGLAQAARVYNRPGKKLFHFNFQRVGGKAPSIFYVLLFAGWFILFARNFYAYKLISVPIKNFFIQKRSIGEFSFSIGYVLEFFLILYISGMISRLVSFFASDRAAEQGVAGRKTGIGSWLLIIRISITSIGVLVAFAAVGIPMDRLTIILSALSVGIGFGLQNLVNSLVSGLIISVEKPVNVGDIVEIGGQSGTVKSIGFRSSIITTVAGADVVIPNSEVLNQHLVNWTRENTSRSVDVPVGVAYGTDLEHVIKILEELPAKDERILMFPKPNVLVRQFNSSAIDMQLSFWVKNITDTAAVRSDILLAIDRAFKENSIKIPLPQQELHISSLSKEELYNKIDGEKKQ
jgi:potassium efflux system protein